MINTNELKAVIVKKGLTQYQVARNIGIAPKTFSLKLKKGVFGSDEIEKMIILLDLKNPMSIFFSS